ncbi:hypothetical protein Dip510_001423 [Elusimicrobium posterum]|uniref:DUF1893 domain-containing protein n=1 Tax=Elusimicrobium posterum TaxID=3116653 RepID=UPI003C77290A
MKIINLLKVSAVLLIGVLMLTGCSDKKKEISLQDMKALSKSHALVVAYNDGTVRTYDDKGIKPLFRHIAGFGDFKGAYVFDKVTGKASALVLAYGGAEKLYTGVLSKEAIPVLEKYNIAYDADQIVDFIHNMTGDDACPMEKSVNKLEEPEEAYKVLKERFNK